MPLLHAKLLKINPMLFRLSEVIQMMADLLKCYIVIKMLTLKCQWGKESNSSISLINIECKTPNKQLENKIQQGISNDLHHQDINTVPIRGLPITYFCYLNHHSGY